METVIVKTFTSRIEAEVDKSILDSQGIKAIINADDAGGSAPYLLNSTGFVKLLVNKKDFKKAYKILKVKSE